MNYSTEEQAARAGKGGHLAGQSSQILSPPLWCTWTGDGDSPHWRPTAMCGALLRAGHPVRWPGGWALPPGWLCTMGRATGSPSQCPEGWGTAHTSQAPCPSASRSLSTPWLGPGPAAGAGDSLQTALPSSAWSWGLGTFLVPVATAGAPMPVGRASPRNSSRATVQGCPGTEWQLGDGLPEAPCAASSPVSGEAERCADNTLSNTPANRLVE